ncbi:hypothetical protein L2E82_44188 [Cichorium intybus]|uniref:Uncharacterized protein n=1 Tax=Cichorium intybus TaxID=13427 RepID=A0ACB8ZP20_CICIN|nr:hypothetical protein L2E82_44188 [Cichorium intybus]
MTFLITSIIQFFIISTSKFFIYPINDSKIHVEKKTQNSRLSKRSPSFEYRSLRRDEVEIVMGNLGISHPKGENFPQRLSSNDLFNIFEEENPRLDEVKAAFDVFDENKDGFIDANELQRVLYKLGLNDRVGIDDCKKMIRVFDANDDGRIDFDEFVKFMEGTFC